LLWIAVAPAYAVGLSLVARLFAPVLERDPQSRYVVEGSRLLAQRPFWLPRQQRAAPLVQPLWIGAQNFGPPLLAALIVATPRWSWRRRGRGLAVGLGLLTLTQVAGLIVSILATQQSPITTAEGVVPPVGYSAFWAPVLYWIYYFFDIVGRGFFALLIWAGLIALPSPPARSAPAAGRNSPCPCGSGLKYKRCCGRW
jgi:SEC-C motif-containing protein